MTGGTGAIGAAICSGLIERGFEVVLVTRDAAKGQRRAAEIERRIRAEVMPEAVPESETADKARGEVEAEA